MNALVKLSALLLTAMLLGACSGGSSGNTTPVNTPTTPTAPTTPTTPTSPTPGSSELNALVEQRVFDAAQLASDGVLSIEVGANDVSVLVNIRTTNTEAGMAVTEIRDPSDQVIYSADLGSDGVENVQSDFFNEITGAGELAVFMPPTPEMTLTPGNYQFRVVREDDAELSSVRAFVKSNPEGGDIDATALKFDLNVWVAHSDAFFAGDSFQNTVRTAYVDSINTILEDHNLSVGTVNFFQANADQTETFRSLDVENEFGDACRAMLADTGAGLALNLVFVEELSSENTPGIAGVAPSPGVINDTTAGESCFFVAQTAYVANPAEDLSEQQANNMQAGNILHEAAHFMSIQHTTEENGMQFDNFNDTPECDAATFDGRNNATFGVPGQLDGEMSDHECSFEGGADNVVFYAGHQDFLPFRMSEDQAWVLRRHPLSIPE